MNKALTVKQPWAWAIIHGDKDIENRSRPTKHRGRLYIHAGLGFSDDGLLAVGAENMPPDADLLAGQIIGTVDVIGCHPAEECADVVQTGEDDWETLLCSEWAMPGHFHWVLDNARPLACPFPEKGKLGIWTLGGAALASVQ